MKVSLLRQLAVGLGWLPLVSCASSAGNLDGESGAEPCLIGSCQGGAVGEPVLISSEHSGEAGTAQVAMNTAGSAMVVWVWIDATESHLRAARYEPGSGWAEPWTVASAPWISPHPNLTIDERGNSTAVWTQTDATGDVSTIWTSSHESDGGWTEPEELSAEGETMMSAPVLAQGDDGTLVALWLDVELWGLRARVRPPESGWGEVVTVSAGSRSDATGSVSVAPDGSAIAMWSGSVDGPDALLTQGAVVWANRYYPETGWGTAAPISADTQFGSQFAPLVDAGNEEHVTAAYTAPTPPTVSTYLARFSPDEGWSSELLRLDSSSPEISVDAQGDALVVWASVLDNHVGAHYSERSTGRLTELVVDTADAQGTSRFPQLAGNVSGDAVAVWFRSNGFSDDVWTNRYVPGTGWGSTTRIATTAPACGEGPCTRLESLDAAMDGSGNAVVVWSERHAYHADQYARLLERRSSN